MERRAARPGLAGHWLVALLLAINVVMTAALPQDSDFEFEGGEDNGGAPVVDATFMDDEDFKEHADDGSGPVYDVVTSSGDGIIMPPTPVYPSGPDEVPEFYRGTLNFTSLFYDDTLLNRNNSEFKTMAALLVLEIESIYADMPGTQQVNVIQLRPGSTEVARPTLYVTFDLSTVGYYNQQYLFQRINGAVQDGMVGRYNTTREGFTWRLHSGTRPPQDILCGPLQFKCNNGDCIDLIFRCDLVNDCGDASDEDGCEQEMCEINEFRCSNGRCIDSIRRCDGVEDCDTGEDEQRCAVECERGEVECRNGRCVDLGLLCDGNNDCGDGTDEEECAPPQCADDEFQCTDGLCIPITSYCDGQQDCDDRTDEVDCSIPIVVTASPSRIVIREGMEAIFLCRATGSPTPSITWTRVGQPLPLGASDEDGRLTVRQARASDSGIYTCVAENDLETQAISVILRVEIIDGPVVVPPVSGLCEEGNYLCPDTERCIPNDFKCDGDRDCPGGEDEDDCAFDEPCEPNEHKCTSGRCIQIIWRCDGDNDCGDGSDEVDCPAADPGSLCDVEEYQCADVDQCIPASYQCDDQYDCQDRSDEIGCSAPTVVEPPPPTLEVQQGNTVRIVCAAIGVPVPLIVWRLNWGHVGAAPRVYQTTEDGQGVLVITQASKEDEGAYTCEAINNRGSIFAQPDTILMVNPIPGLCQPPVFNVDARSTADCLQCFCFEQSNTCYSSNDYLSEINAGGTISLVDQLTIRPVDSSLIQVSDDLRTFSVEDYYRKVRGGAHYWSLPRQFVGERLTSYGSDLAYRVLYDSPYADSFISDPDIIISGNGQNLFHVEFTEAFKGTSRDVEVALAEGEWTVDALGQVLASRGDIMFVLENIDYILIKSSYDTFQEESSVGYITMGSATDQETGLGRAVLVESCVCPTGYTGSSCQDCAPGFRRVASGLYLGSCVPCDCNGHSNDCDQITGVCRDCLHNSEGEQCGRCSPGYYGDATVGTPMDCQVCPCPLSTPENQFAQECILEDDNRVTCLGCPEGYTGRQCESCMPGLEGDPTVPGDYCKPARQQCDIRGAVNPLPDLNTGQCECLPYAEGELCSECKTGTFHLSEENPDGCSPCFCMGVSGDGQPTVCASTTRNRATLSTVFNLDPQGFVLTDSSQFETFTEGLSVNAEERELVYQDAASLPDAVFFWSLPEKYLGNKLTSYGGYLRYTVTYVPGVDDTPETFFPNIEIAGSDITLVHYDDETQIEPNVPTTFQIPLREVYWVAPDGRESTREHMLMALADLRFIIIKATYTTDSEEFTIRDVSLDIAEDRRTGLSRAWEVEQCRCPPGYEGLSCETCAVGYRRTGGGLYLGNCMECDCNGHSYDCHPMTGQCRECQHNTEGWSCDQCAPGFYGDATEGSPNDCRPCPCPLTSEPNQFSPTCSLDVDGAVTCTACPVGHTGRRCESCLEGYIGDPLIPGSSCRPNVEPTPADCAHCDPRGNSMTGACDQETHQCHCKDNVYGENCGLCKLGYFYLSEASPDGCLSCYCSGLSTECSSSPYFRQKIRPAFQPDGTHNFQLTTRRLDRQITDGFVINAPANEITFNRFTDVQQERLSLYFNLPPRFRGNQIGSYGGKLHFNIEYQTASLDEGNTYYDVDVEIISGSSRLYYFLSPSPLPGRDQTYDVLLTEEAFTSIDRTRPTRETFMKVLSDIDAILIRGTYHSIAGSTSLRNLYLETAVPENTGLQRTLMVEQCVCPLGYTGLSCEECSPGYSSMPDPDAPSGKSCVQCACFGHASTCNPHTGECLNCQHNTEGHNCEACVAGYYGDPTAGTPNDCRQCLCPTALPSNQFSETCVLGSDGRPTCDACAEGYTGRNCESCAPGYVGNPREIGGSCERDTGDLQPSTIVSPPRSTHAIGGVATLTCSVEGRGPFNVRWMRADGRPLPSGSEVGEDYTLTINRMAPTDAGRYICVAASRYGSSQDEAELSVIGEGVIMVIVEEPKAQTATEGSTVRFICTAISQYTYTLAWQREDGPLPDRAEDDGEGTLTIRNVQPQDAGTYKCIGSNFYNMGSDRGVLVVPVTTLAPTIRIEPRYLTVPNGQSVQFQCIAEGTPAPTVTWQGGRNGELAPDVVINGGMLRIEMAREVHQAEYYCVARNSEGEANVRTILYVDGEDPDVFEVIVTEEDLVVPPGEAANLQCQAKGVVEVDRIVWSRYNGELPPGAIQDNGLLVIPECRITDTGRYICTIYLSNGESKVAYTDLVIQHPGPGTGPGLQAPTAMMDPQRLTVGQGLSASFRCVVTGSPPPTVTWSKVRAELGPNHLIEDNVLRVVEATPEDRGQYVCLVENSAGRDQASGILQIERREMPRIELYPELSQVVRIGGSTFFQCRPIAGAPQPNITWSRPNGEPLTSNTETGAENGVIRFVRIEGPEQGPYVCTATNELGSVSATAMLLVQGPPAVTISPTGPISIQEGLSLSLECVADGDPLPTVMWVRPGDGAQSPRLSEDALPGGETSALLTIQSVSIEDSGNYICLAVNSAGSTRTVIQVTVLRRSTTPSPTEAPVEEFIAVSVVPEILTVAEGMSATFTCSAIGSPEPVLRWRFEGGALPANHQVRDGVLVIRQVHRNHAGNYYCMAHNIAGRHEAAVRLEVIVAPTLSISPNQLTVRSGNPLQLHCHAMGTQPITIEWSKMDSVLSSAARDQGGLLQIAAATPADAGIYRCVAYNEAGRSSMNAQVVVLSPPTAVVSPRTLSATQGQTVALRCDYTGMPVPTVRWSKENDELPQIHTTSNGILTLYNVQQGDEGRYICVATNEAGSSRDYSIVSIIGDVTTQPPIPETVKTVAIGDRIEFTCDATGHPVPMVTWERADAPMSPSAIINGSVMIIPIIEESDAGTYRCVASSVAGMVFAQVAILVESPPVIPVTHQSRTVSIGSTITLACHAHGNPPPVVVWSKRGDELPRDHEVRNGVLIIPYLREEDLGEYICTARNQRGVAEGIIELKTGYLVPYFQQNPASFIAYPTISDAYSNFDIELSFRPETTDGLLVYNGAMDGSLLGDYLAFGLHGRRADFRFNMGSGPAIIVSEPLSLNEWHTVRFRREGLNGALLVDGQLYTGMAPGSYRGLDLQENLYVGGVPDYTLIPPSTGFTQGFVGGLSRMVINGQLLDLGGAARRMEGILSTQVCITRPCSNGGMCRPAPTKDGYECTCPRGYSGRTCELVGEQCFPGVCGEGGRCRNLVGRLGYICVCPMGKAGDRCELGITITDPSFNFTSYAEYAGLTDSQNEVEIRMLVMFHSVDQGLLFFNGQAGAERQDFIALVVREGRVELRYDSGSGEAVIRSDEDLELGRWTLIVAERNERDGSLSIDGGVAVKGLSPEGLSPGDTRGLNLAGNLYLGGVSSEVYMPAGVGVTQGLHGCISELEVNNVPVDLINTPITYRDIGNCRDENPCGKRPCQNGGLCVENGGQYRCQCPSTFTGTDCETQMNVCLSANPCANGATCIAVRNSFICSCAFGYTGRTCNTYADITTAVEFLGTGRVVLPGEMMPHIADETIELTISTVEPEGLILWHGQEEDQPGKVRDYLALALQGGKAVFTFELGDSPVNITTDVMINDGRPHTIVAQRSGKRGSIEVDSFIFAQGQSTGILTTINTNGNIYLGGLPNAELMTGGLLTEAFVGCIKDIYINDVGPLDLSQEAIDGTNVRSCVS